MTGVLYEFTVTDRLGYTDDEVWECAVRSTEEAAEFEAAMEAPWPPGWLLVLDRVEREYAESRYHFSVLRAPVGDS